jgi:hypothetical protein
MIRLKEITINGDLKAGEKVRGSPKRARCSRDFSKGGSIEKCCW